MNTAPPTNFIHLVFQMREAQRLYFKKPIQPRLIHAKQLEQEVDRWIENEKGVRDLEFPPMIPPEEIPY